MASAVGPIPAGGGNFLQFLIAIRKIVEQGLPVEDRLCELKDALKLLEWRGFARKLKSPRHGDLVDQLFPLAVDSIPGLPPSTKESLTAAKLKTAAKIAAALDAELLKHKGIGLAKIAAIRRW